MTPEEVADFLGVKLATIYKWSHEKRIPRVRALRLLRFRPSEIEKWLDDRDNADRQRAEEAKAKTAARQAAAKQPRRKTPFRDAEVDRMVDRIKKEAGVA